MKMKIYVKFRFVHILLLFYCFKEIKNRKFTKWKKIENCWKIAKKMHDKLLMAGGGGVLLIEEARIYTNNFSGTNVASSM